MDIDAVEGLKFRVTYDGHDVPEKEMVVASRAGRMNFKEIQKPLERSQTILMLQKKRVIRTPVQYMAGIFFYSILAFTSACAQESYEAQRNRMINRPETTNTGL